MISKGVLVLILMRCIDGWLRALWRRFSGRQAKRLGIHTIITDSVRGSVRRPMTQAELLGYMPNWSPDEAFEVTPTVYFNKGDDDA